MDRWCKNRHKHVGTKDDLFCPKCGDALLRASSSSPKPPYDSTYGRWEVTTEGDCEGKSVKSLGVHKGHVDEIARSLASSTMYGLHFQAVPARGTPAKGDATSVSISFDLSSGISPDADPRTKSQRLELVDDLFKDRPVRIESSNYYGCVKLVWDSDESGS